MIVHNKTTQYSSELCLFLSRVSRYFKIIPDFLDNISSYTVFLIN